MTNMPITPPPELRCQWQSESPFKVISVEREDHMIDRTARWAADEQLRLVEEHLRKSWQWADEDIEELHDAMRPKPLTQAEEALRALETAFLDTETYVLVKEALENLRGLEKKLK